MYKGKKLLNIMFLLYLTTNFILLTFNVVNLDDYGISTSISSFLLFCLLYNSMVKGNKIVKIIFIILAIITFIGCMFSFKTVIIDSLGYIINKPLYIFPVLGFTLLTTFSLFTFIILVFSKEVNLYLSERKKIEKKYKSYIKQKFSENN